MSISPPGSPKLFARNITAYSDAELDRYLEDNRGIVELEDPENLPETFIQRLRDRAHGQTAKSRPVDLDQVATQLLGIPANDEEPTRSHFRSTVPPQGHGDDLDRDHQRLPETGSDSDSMASRVTQPRGTESEEEELRYEENLHYEREAYKVLVARGVRPVYPASRLEDVARRLARRRPVNDDGPRRTLRSQLVSWEDFLRVQKFARGQSAEDSYRDEIIEGLPAWPKGFGIEMQSGRRRSDYRRKKEEEMDAQRDWQSFKDFQKAHGNDIVIVGGRKWPWATFTLPAQAGEEGRFPPYARAVKARLTRHGFTRPFQLDEDAARQDKLTTWIEYLAYEYWWYELYAPSKRQQQRYEKAWKKLVHSGVLTPSDTEESICSVESGYRDQARVKSAEKAMRSAQSIVALAERAVSDRPDIDRRLEEYRQRILQKARSRLDMAVKEYNTIKKRYDLTLEFAGDTKFYRIKRSDAGRHMSILQWIMEQIPLIEKELKLPDNTAASHSAGGVCRSGQKPDRVDVPANSRGGGSLKRRSDDIVDGEGPSKRLRHAGRKQGLRKTPDPVDTTEPRGWTANREAAGTARSTLLTPPSPASSEGKVRNHHSPLDPARTAVHKPRQTRRFQRRKNDSTLLHPSGSRRVANPANTKPRSQPKGQSERGRLQSTSKGVKTRSGRVIRAPERLGFARLDSSGR
ncbi:hypothetical protein ACJ73_00056 [Blastomyces percursus]|uniref:Uncharacterized protein n=1 Tax=Blastomyces percursus TaxID=1658174 RepID=A0A1J9QJ97_9EURO|nr:hypothetical protein ACJ73_00056 [Blastomyces percursus]